jgi:hypothetical protein
MKKDTKETPKKKVPKKEKPVMVKMNIFKPFKHKGTRYFSQCKVPEYLVNYALSTGKGTKV